MFQGFADKGGARQEDAWELWAKAGLDDGFQHAWLLSDVNQDGFLSEQARAGPRKCSSLESSRLQQSSLTAAACALQHG